MSVKKVLSIISVLTFGGMLLIPASGCNHATAMDPSEKPAIPPLDMVTHDEVETAYFALG